jgi:hypothetical protein
VLFVVVYLAVWLGAFFGSLNYQAVSMLVGTPTVNSNPPAGAAVLAAEALGVGVPLVIRRVKQRRLAPEDRASLWSLGRSLCGSIWAIMRYGQCKNGVCINVDRCACSTTAVERTVDRRGWGDIADVGVDAGASEQHQLARSPQSSDPVTTAVGRPHLRPHAASHKVSAPEHTRPRPATGSPSQDVDAEASRGASLQRD